MFSSYNYVHCIFSDSQNILPYIEISNMGWFVHTHLAYSRINIELSFNRFSCNMCFLVYFQIHNPLYLMLKPSKKDEAQAFIQFFQANFWFNIILFVQNSFVVDGFYDAMKQETSGEKWNVRAQIVSERISKWKLALIVTSLLGNSPQIIVLHTKVGLCKRIFEVVQESNFSHINHAWFLTELSYTRDFDDMHAFPTGTLSIVPNYVVHTDDIVVDGTNLLLKAVAGLPSVDRKFVHRDCYAHPTAQQILSGDAMYRLV